jgi:fibronectin type 3 domain-containing protein
MLAAVPAFAVTADSILQINQADAEMGRSVSGAGDVNGDGYADVIVGAPYYANGQAEEGAFFIYHGSASGISTTPAAMVESNTGGIHMGWSVSDAGDVNGDGYGDVIVGAPDYSNGLNQEGAFYVYHGSASGISTTPAAMIESNQAVVQMGYSVSGAGDVNGDGYNDVIVGVQNYSNILPSEGAAFIYHGSASGIGTTPAAIAESNQGGARMGRSVSGAGDINGDGFADIIAGASSYKNAGETYKGGAAFIYYGSASGIDTTLAAKLNSDQDKICFGQSVSAGDVNGDGYNDVIIGARLYDNGESDEGAAFVYHGGPSGISTIPAVMLESNQSNAEMGRSVSIAGDVNGDGYDDVIVGVPNYTNGESDEGAFLVYHGSATGISTTPADGAESNQAGAWMGFSVSGAGDINGDGYDDVIIGARVYDNPELDEGAAFVYHGETSGSPPSTPTGVSATAVSSSEIQVIWNASTGANVYEIWRNSTVDGTTTLSGTTSATSYINTGLASGTQYCYQISAYNYSDNGSDLSTVSCATTSGSPPPPSAPSTPTGVNATAVSSEEIQVIWNTSSGATGYDVWRSSTVDGTSPGGTFLVDATTTNYSDSGLVSEEEYCYKVLAFDGSGNESELSVQSCATTLNDAAPLPVPTGISASAVSSEEIQVIWNTSTGATGYEVWRNSTVDGTTTYMGTTSATSYSDTGLDSETQYCYKVLAYDGSGSKSDFSGQSCAATLSDAAPLPVPTGVSAAAVSSDEIDVIWNESTGADGYEVWRSSTVDGTSPGGTFLIDATTTNYNDTGLVSEAEYCYKVLANDSSGNESELSEQACATTLSDVTPLPVPTGVSASAVSTSEIQVIWNDSTGADGYEIWRTSTVDGVSGTMVGSVSSTSYNDTGLIPSNIYCYEISAYDLSGNESELSEQSCAATSEESPGNGTTNPGPVEVKIDDDGVKAEGCFIATAAYGSYLDPHVKVLRDFRDDHMLTNFIGRAFVSLYYRTSPPVANFIEEHESLKSVTRLALMPVVYGVKHPTAVLMLFGMMVGLTVYRKKIYCFKKSQDID